MIIKLLCNRSNMKRTKYVESTLHLYIHSNLPVYLLFFFVSNICGMTYTSRFTTTPHTKVHTNDPRTHVVQSTLVWHTQLNHNVLFYSSLYKGEQGVTGPSGKKSHIGTELWILLDPSASVTQAFLHFLPCLTPLGCPTS